MSNDNLRAKPIDAIHSGISLNGNQEDVQSHYDVWAETYDADLGEEDYIGPKEIVNILVEYLNAQDILDYNAKLVDGGCGTGLVGKYLKQVGFSTIDGFDLSAGMVEKAKELTIYNRLEGAVGFAEAADVFEHDSYDIAVTCGVFTHGHVPPEAVFDFAKILKSNGLMLVSTRPSYCEETDFERISQSQNLKLEICFKDRPYTSDENAHYWFFSKEGA